MKLLYHDAQTTYDPATVKVTVKSRNVTVEGPRGKLEKNIPCEVTIKNDVKTGTITVFRYFSNKREKSQVRTARSLIENMITGVTKGYTYFMKLIFNHFPARVNVNGRKLNVENFMGGRHSYQYDIPEGITFEPSTELKDHFYLKGNSNDEIGRFYSRIHTALKAKNRDRRKFLDGMYLISKS